MQIVTLDFKSFFDNDYNLNKMTTEAYVRDPRFEALGMAVLWPDGASGWYTGTQIGAVLAAMAIPKDLAVLCHHSAFDCLILNHHYGFRPHAILDTLSMARLVIGNHLSVSLAALADTFGLSPKSVPYSLFKGKHWADLDSWTQRAVGDGGIHDCILTRQLFDKLANGFPLEEYPVIDMTIRMFTEPQFEGDQEKLGEVWSYEHHRKVALLAKLGVSAVDLQSADRFAELLRGAGIEPGVKPSPSDAGRNIYAFAKTDGFMKELLEDDNDTGRSLAEARLGVKSTLDQTRAERIGFMAQRGALPIYLNYAGAHTSRWSGGDSLNWQNLKRGSELRKSVVAPRGHHIIKADKSQVECRFLNMVAGQDDVIERFANGEDPYVGIASKFYGRAITKDDPAERGVGKQLELSCGYGAGSDTIAATAAKGTYGPPVKLSGAEALAARDLYRGTHPGVVDLWNFSDWCIGQMTAGCTVIWKDVIEIKGTTVYLPNGIPLHYPELQWDGDLPQKNGRSGGYKYKTRNGWKDWGIWGGFIVENFIQALSRVDMSQTLLRVLYATGYRPALLEHDAAAWIIPDNEVDKVRETIRIEMCRAPTWMPTIPLGCDISVSERYS